MINQSISGLFMPARFGTAELEVSQMAGDEKGGGSQGHHLLSGLAHEVVEDRARKHHTGNADRSEQKHTAILVPPAAEREGEHGRGHNQPQHRPVKGLAVQENGRHR